MNNNQPTLEATFTVRHYTESEKLRRIAAEKQKIAMDELWKLSVAKAEGEAMGIAKGRAEGRAEGEAKKEAEIIAKLQAAGMSDKQIQAILGFSPVYLVDDVSPETQDEDYDLEP